jgi:hypothetical protein
MLQFEGSLLHEAVAIGGEEIVKLLLRAKARVNVRDKVGTILHVCGILFHDLSKEITLF